MFHVSLIPVHDIRNVSSIGSWQNVMWTNRTVPVALGKQSFYSDVLASTVEGSVYKLTILSAQLHDEGDYVCTILGIPTQGVRHVTVNSKFTVLSYG